jgi:hypothetical protein
MHNQKAHALITFLVPLIHFVNGDDLPMNERNLRAYPQVNAKKARVAMNGFGLTAGSGFNTHCIGLVSLLLKKHILEAQT